ncbi:MAG: hypothetical protein M3164_05650 [Actinomycetota bacterium]|nr:hypothetical protein [Actinomycetota bacterium]
MDVKKFLWWGIGAAVALVVVAVTLIVVLQGRDRGRPDEAAAPGQAGGDGGGEQREQENIDEQTFEGSGRGTPRFRGAGGLTIFRFSHEGRRNFVLTLSRGGATGGTLIVNAVGEFNGSKAMGLEAGDYTVDVTASGPWTLEVEQPRPTSAPSAPQELEGRGQGATSFFRLRAGPANFRMSFQGEGIFAPNLLRADGQTVTLLANELARFNGSKQVNIAENGIYLIDVTATGGNWTIDVSQ